MGHTIKIISGGQTGADRGALIAAKSNGIKTGGWMPKGYLASDGVHPEFSEVYGIKEHSSPRYQPRTALNVKISDLTIRIATNFRSPGEILIMKMIHQYKKPSLDIYPFNEQHTPNSIVDFILLFQISVINVAGNSEKTSRGIQEFTVEFIGELIQSHKRRSDN